MRSSAQFVFVLASSALLWLPCNSQSSALISQYQLYSNYSVTAFDNAVPQIVPSLIDCVMYSTVSPASNGVMYNDANKNCIVLTSNNNEVLLTLHWNPGWLTYVKDISTVERMVFKAQSFQSSAALNQNIGSAFLNINSATYTTNYTVAGGSFAPFSCNCTYRNPYIDNWNVSEVGQLRLLLMLIPLKFEVVNLHCLNLLFRIDEAIFS